MKFPIEKYNYDIHQHPEYLGVEVVATSTYAGQPVFGKAICHVNDAYNEEKGMKLAAARCAEKIARKRKARSAKRLREAQDNYAKAMKFLNDMKKYHNDAVIEHTMAELELKDILREM